MVLYDRNNKLRRLREVKLEGSDGLNNSTTAGKRCLSKILIRDPIFFSFASSLLVCYVKCVKIPPPLSKKEKEKKKVLATQMHGNSLSTTHASIHYFPSLNLTALVRVINVKQ